MFRLGFALAVFVVFADFAPAGFATRALASEPSSGASAAQWIASARALKLSQRLEWLRLLHYDDPDWTGRLSSPARGDLFFLSPEGRNNAEAELEATLRGFFRTATAEESPAHRGAAVPGRPERQPPQCQFPARLIWLEKELHFGRKDLPSQDCARYEGFTKALSAKSVTLVFSSYYLNNPSSAFGHTFLRLNQSFGARPGEDLLDYGVSYAAVADSGNAVLYAFRGLLGLFPGSFASEPYYYKIREYSDYEARDLWEYDLNLTAEQTAFLVAHVWELGSTWFPYFYVSKNCAYEVLELLDAADPSLHLVDDASWVVIPSDTVDVVSRAPGLVTGIHYRPSIRTQFSRRVGRFSGKESHALSETIAALSAEESSGKAQAFKEYWSGAGAQGLTSREQVEVLDAATDYVDWNYGKEIIDPEKKNAPSRPANWPAVWKDELLLARSEIDLPSQEEPVPPPWKEMPQEGHGSRRVSLDSGYSGHFGSYTTLQYRFALHDLADPSPGYPEYAQLEMGALRFRMNAQPSSFWVDDVNAFRIVSLNPLQPFDHGFSHILSWMAALQGKRFYDGICGVQTCFGPSFEAGGGLAVNPVKNVPLTAYLFGSGEFIASPSFPGAHFRPGLGPTAGLRYHPSDLWGMTLQSGYRYRLLPGPHQGAFSEWVTRLGLGPDSPEQRRFAIEARVDQYFPSYLEGALGVSYFY